MTEKQNKKPEKNQQENIEKTPEKSQEKENSEKIEKENPKKKIEQKEKKNKQITENPKKKEKAIVNIKSVPISTKHSISICKFIKGDTIEKAVTKLQQVLNKKTPVPMKGELPHQKGIMSGRFPEKTSRHFLKILKSLMANSINNGIENPDIFTAKANKASRPYKRFGQKKMKRTHVYLEAKDTKNNKQRIENNKQKTENPDKKENKKPQKEK